MKAYPLKKLYLSSTYISANRYWLPAIIGVALLLRIAMAFYLGNQVVELPGTFDQISYDMLAQQVLNGHGFTVAERWWPMTPAGEPTAHWSYLYTLFLTTVYGLVGYYPLVARLIQAGLAGILMPWLTYRLGRRHFGRQVGLVAAGLTAVYVYFFYYAAALMTETFYIIAILWVLDLAGQIGIDRSPARRNWLFLGLALGTTVLLRQVFLLFIPFLFGWLLWRSYGHQVQSLKRTIAGLVMATVLLVVLVVPWTVRNYLAFDRFVLLNTNAGFAFFWGNHPIHGYNFIDILPADGPSYQELIPPALHHLNEGELDQALLKRSLAQIGADPGRYLILSMSRTKDYFKFWPSSESSLISNLSRILSFGILLPFMIYGLIYSWRHYRGPETLLFYLFILVYTGIHLLSWALIRYRLPVDAVLILFAGVALVDLYQKFRSRSDSNFFPISF